MMREEMRLKVVQMLDRATLKKEIWRAVLESACEDRAGEVFASKQCDQYTARCRGLTRLLEVEARLGMLDIGFQPCEKEEPTNEPAD